MDRRRFIKAAGTAGTVVVAGCLDTEEDDEETPEEGTDDEDAVDEDIDALGYESFLYDFGEVDDGIYEGNESYTFRYAVGTEMTEALLESEDERNLVEGARIVSPAAVDRIDFHESQESLQEATSDLDDRVPLDSLEGYDLYEWAEQSKARNEDELSSVFSTDAPSTRVIIRTLNDDTHPATQANDDLADLVGGIGEGDGMIGSTVITGGIDEAEAVGVSFYDEGDQIRIRHAVVFSNSGAASTVPVVELVEGRFLPERLLIEPFMEGFRLAVEIEDEFVDGRVAVVESTLRRSVFFGDEYVG